MAASNSVIYEQTKQSPLAAAIAGGNKPKAGGTPHFHAQHQTGPFDSPSSSASTRFRAKDRDRPGKNASGASSIGSSLCVQQTKTGGASRPHQRERRRTKRRESYVRSTEGTSTGDEETGFGENYDGSTNRQCHLCPSPPTDFAEKVNACRGNRSPSDLDADDEDNQDYDSTSMVSNLDPAPLSPQQAGATAGASILSKASASFGGSNENQSSSFRTQFQKIRVAGMQKLADVGGGGESDTGALLSDSSRESDACCKPTNAAKSGQQQLQEKTALILDLNDKEKKITEMEKTIKDLNLRLRESEIEQEKLKLENQSLRSALFDKRE